jgi:hypothetical protein
VADDLPKDARRGRDGKNPNSVLKRLVGAAVAEKKEGFGLEPKLARRLDKQFGLASGVTQKLYDRGDPDFWTSLETTQKALAAGFAQVSAKALGELDSRLNDPEIRAAMKDETLLKVASAGLDRVLAVDGQLRLKDSAGKEIIVVQPENC